MNVIGCMDRPTSGEYFLDGKELSKASKNELAYIRNQKFGFVFQSFNLLARTTALENVELPLQYWNKLSGKERHRRSMEALERVGLADRVKHHPSQLSGGQQQRVAIARALVAEPRLILADEPTGNLDTETSAEIIALLRRLNTAQQLTILIVTHDSGIARQTDRVLLMRDGRLVADGSPTAVLAGSAA
jgi:putative ABC transport system ATP-binding protein